MATTFLVGDRIIYTGVKTKSRIGQHGTILCVGTDTVTVKFDKHMGTQTVYQNNVQLSNPTENEKLSMLLNKRITNEQYERM